MRPSPFTGKFKRKDIKIEKNQDQPKHEQGEDQKGVAKLPTFSTGSRKFKDPKKIYDALREPSGEIEEKPSISLKPNLKLKAGKKIKLAANNSPKDIQQQQEQPQEISKPFLKPNLKHKNRQQEIIIENQQRQNTYEEEEDEQSQSQSMSIAPKFKIKSRAQQESERQTMIQELPQEDQGPGISNYANLKIEARELNLNSENGKVSEVKIQKQESRTRDLQKLLNLEIDLFEETLSIPCVTSYEVYINKIKNGSLKNSNDQAFDEKNAISCQTYSMEFEDFTNQCPQDYHTDVTSIVQNDETQAFNRFIEKVSPVFEELIKPSSSIMMPPIFLLALRPEFKKLVNCPYPVFVYFSESLQVGIIVIGEKLYIAESEIVSVVSLGSNMVAGCRDGTIHLWSGKNARGSRTYRKIYDLIQSSNFELPEYDTNELDRFSIYRTDAAIVSLHSVSSDEFYSLDSSCRMTKWKVENIHGRKNELKPLSLVQFFNIIQKPSIMGTVLHRRNDLMYVGTSSGILVWNGDDILQRMDTDGFPVLSIALPHRSTLVYASCEDNSVRIFDQNYSNHLIKITLPEGDPLTTVFIPETEYENKKLSLTNKIFAITHSGKVYEYNLLHSRSEGKLLSGDEEDQEDKEDRNIIFKGVNILGEQFEKILLWRDLKCKSSRQSTGVKLESTVGNIKSILQQNRHVHSLMQSETGLIIV